VTRYPSFQELQAETMRLRDAGDVAGALALMTGEGTRFPDQAAYAYFWRMRLHCELAQLDEALRLFAEALSVGCRYPLPVLQSGQLRPLHETVEFERLAHIAAMRYDAELAASRPKLVLRHPRGTARGTLLVLHGNNSRADRTVPHWEHALELGWILALAQSAEISWTPGMFVWNDASRAREQLMQHVRELRTDGALLAIAGYSMGALRALELAASVPDAAHGVITIAPFIPREPAEHLAAALAVPTAIVVGEHDREGRPGAETIDRGLRARGIPVRLDVVAGAGHEYPSDMGQRLEAVLPLVSGR
jgi:predicted esterase